MTPCFVERIRSEQRPLLLERIDIGAVRVIRHTVEIDKTACGRRLVKERLCDAYIGKIPKEWDLKKSSQFQIRASTAAISVQRRRHIKIPLFSVLPASQDGGIPFSIAVPFL